MKPRPLTLEKLFPNPAGRKAGDEAIDDMDPSLPLNTFLDAWEAAYWERTGTSPFRR